MNTIQIKNGSTVPLNSQLANYELGYVRGGNLYINNGGAIIQLTDSRVIGIINSDNYLQLPKIEQADFEANKFLIANSENEVYHRTAEQVLSDIGAFSASGGTISGDVLINNSLTLKDLFLNGKIVLKEGIHYGYSNPNIAKIEGVKGQLYFVLSD